MTIFKKESILEIRNEYLQFLEMKTEEQNFRQKFTQILGLDSRNFRSSLSEALRANVIVDQDDFLSLNVGFVGFQAAAMVDQMD